ncbi:MAG: hypothetical protein FJ276_20660, partial [Planctomycetes bacterium]|nr:hypothetical protein [Planctomycetota bacterium]
MLERLEGRCLLALFTVTNTGDQGAGSLRQAILDANAAAGDGAEIHFAIPPTDANHVDVDSALPGGDPDPDVFVIRPLSGLPALNNPSFGIVIDGRTQSAFGGETNPFGPEIVLNGASAGEGLDGLTLASSSHQVWALNIQQFGDSGVSVTGSNNSVVGCFIGTDPTGTVDRGNRGTGVDVFGGAGNAIGGAAPGSRNVISGNDSYGVRIIGAGASGNQVLGNFIGTDASGTADLGNTFDGVVVWGPASNTTIGGTMPGAGNVISGNDSYGVRIIGDGASGNQVLGNVIGTDASGTADLGNTLDGVVIWAPASNNTIGGTVPGARNIISGNDSYGVRIFGDGASNNQVLGNLIGTDAGGTADLGNKLDGVVIWAPASNNTIGGTAPGARNVISGNDSYGVRIFGAGASGNQVLGNYIGTDLTGNVDLGNASMGVLISGASDNTIGGTDAAARNVISGNSFGVYVSEAGATGNRVLGNFIGTNADGTVAIGNTFSGVVVGSSGNVVGGTAIGKGNVVSGNGRDGIEVSGDVNLVAGNYIGTDWTGTVPLGNADDGVEISGTGNVLGGAEFAARNVISGNLGDGVMLSRSANDNQILGNYIGTDVHGRIDLGNASNGITLVEAVDNVIGEVAAGAGNLISGNDRHGIEIAGTASTGNRVVGNRIGTDAAGTVALANASDGVSVFDSFGNVIGGTAPGAGNTISGNGRHGVSVISPPRPGDFVGVQGPFQIHRMAGTGGWVSNSPYDLESFTRFPGIFGTRAAFLGIHENGWQWIYRADPGKPVKQAFEPRIVPPDRRNFTQFGDQISLDSESLVFRGKDGTGATGVYAIDDGVFRVVADTNTQVPGSTGLFTAFGQPSIGESGSRTMISFFGRDAAGQPGIYSEQTDASAGQSAVSFYSSFATSTP